MSFEPKILFPGLLADSAARLAQDAASRHPQQPGATVIREMGWNAVLIEESQGGAGGGFADLASIIEGLASNAVDLPVITRCGIVPTMLHALRDNRGAQELLQGIAQGEAVVELGGPLCAGEAALPLSASEGPQGWRVSGETAEITLADDCSHVLLICRSTKDDEWMLLSVDSDALPGPASRYRTMDDRQVAAFRLENMAVEADRVLAQGPEVARARQAGWRVAVAAVATDTVCAMGSALARTIAYLLERRQFGQPLAQFQALRHEVARLYVVYETATNLLQASLRSLGTALEDRDDAAAFALLGLYTGDEAIRFAESVIQLHGGMGMTREMPAARLATRLLANAFRFGDPLAHRKSLHDLRTGMPS
jgi:alkylation response protein AidB-like acyl-CoA dehydrogenase